MDFVDSSAGSLARGDVVAGRYRIDRMVGAGAMGVVLAVTDLDLGRRVALKVPVAPVGFETEMEQRLVEEARLAAQLRSRRVASVLDVGRLESGAPFVTMELLEGESLEQLLERGERLNIAEAVHHLLEACVALAEVHTLGIVHRDVKPDNLFLARELDGTTCLKLLDFGISSFALRQYAHTQASPGGTPLYMAPEQIESPQRCDVRSDIWSLGAVLYELIAGKPPYDADTVGQVIFKTLTTEVPALRDQRDDVPERLEAVVLRCLARDPESRFQNVADLAQELAPFGRPGDARLATMARRIRQISAQRDDLRTTLRPEEPREERLLLQVAARSTQPLPLLRPNVATRPRRRIGKVCAAVTVMLFTFFSDGMMNIHAMAAQLSGDARGWIEKTESEAP